MVHHTGGVMDAMTPGQWIKIGTWAVPPDVRHLRLDVSLRVMPPWARALVPIPARPALPLRTGQLASSIKPPRRSTRPVISDR